MTYLDLGYRIAMTSCTLLLVGGALGAISDTENIWWMQMAAGMSIVIAGLGVVVGMLLMMWGDLL